MPQKLSKQRIVAFSLIPLAVIAVLVGSGVLIGRYTITKSLWKHVNKIGDSETLGEAVERHDRDRKTMAEAYYDPEAGYQDMDRYQYVTPQVLVPFVGHAPMPGQHDGAFISELLFRTPGELELPKAPGVYRIFLVGGSTAFSSGAPDDQRSIGGYLESILTAQKQAGDQTRFEVFTFAQPAWASTQERIAIENRIIEFMPDLVVSLSGANDVFWGTEGRNILWFRSFADDHYFRLLNKVYKFLGAEKMPDVTIVSEDPIPCETVATRLERNVSLSRYALELVGADYLYVLQPTLYTYRSASAEEVDPRRDCYAEIDRRLRALRGGNLSYLSLWDLFDEQEQAAIFLDAVHFGDRGNEQVARAIAGEIGRQAAAQR